MNNVIFKSDRYFAIYDYFISHGQLLIRSQKGDNQKFNIDIIFFDTTFLQSLTMSNGLSISLVKKDNLNKYSSVSEYFSYENSNLFEITSGLEKYYVAASFFKIFENELELNETSLGMIYKGRENEIAGSH